MAFSERIDFNGANTITTKTFESIDYGFMNMRDASIVATPRAGAARPDKMFISVSGSTIDPEINHIDNFSLSVKSTDGVSAVVYIVIAGTSMVDDHGNAHWIRVE